MNAEFTLLTSSPNFLELFADISSKHEYRSINGLLPFQNGQVFILS